ncbi:MAG: Tim44 domain-containing protein [Leptothrix ochracea]|uniref:Tim44 domain-containing protein n=1 Tax=Leptothrix ochracea TaxID=735331 RepID=UPI0034E1F177
MKTLLVTLSMAVAALTFGVAPQDAHAKRLGAGKPAGMQRQQTNTPPAATPPTATPTPTPNPGATAGAATAGAGAAAAAGKRSWMGPLAGLAAGLGIAALMSHFGMGEAFANVMMFALLAMVAVLAIGWLIRRFAKPASASTAVNGMQFAGAGAHGNTMDTVPTWQTAPTPSAVAPSAPSAPAGTTTLASTTPTGSLTALPADFDLAGFERIAKTVFIRMQAANDSGQVEDLRKFTTPELFASLRVDLQERGNIEQHTDVEELHTKIVDAAQEHDQQIVSVRFHGRLSERSQGQTTVESFAELWHFIRPMDGSREWAIAGITPVDSTTH